MTQTKIKGLCAWHKDRGFNWKTFDDDPSTENRVFLRLYCELYYDLDPINNFCTTERDKLKAEGWEVRECYLTIEDI